MSEAEKGWTIAIGSWPYFEIVPATSTERCAGLFGSDADLNGVFTSKAAALDRLISSFEDTRRVLAVQIARAKRMRARHPTQEQG